MNSSLYTPVYRSVYSGSKKLCSAYLENESDNLEHNLSANAK